MHRDFAGGCLNAVLVAPTIRDIPTAVRLGAADGIDRDCIAVLDNLTLLRKDRFVRPHRSAASAVHGGTVPGPGHGRG